MAGLGYKAFSSGEVLTASDLNGYGIEQAVMNFNGTAARGSALPSPSTGMVTHIGGGTVQVYNGTAWVALGGVPNAVLSNTATGTYTSGGTAYAYYEFTASGTATVTTAGLADVLVVAGGAGGMASAGGAGGLLNLTNVYLPAATFTVTIGAGGSGFATATTIRGNNTYFSDFVALGGGQPTDNANYLYSGSSLPSGTCGSSGGSNDHPLITVTTGQGNAGARAVGGVFGGGGGAGGAASGSTAGPGLASAITGTSVTYARGGTGHLGSPTPVAGTANRGDGGGGAAGFTGFAGGSGIVVIRVRT
jgi:hypothetical protein